MREMRITAEQQQGGAEALGEFYPFKVQTGVTTQGFSQQRCAQGAGFETWDPPALGPQLTASPTVSAPLTA